MPTPTDIEIARAKRDYAPEIDRLKRALTAIADGEDLELTDTPAVLILIQRSYAAYDEDESRLVLTADGERLAGAVRRYFP